MSNIEKMLESIVPVINIIGWILIGISLLMLVFSAIKKYRKTFMKLAVYAAACGVPFLLLSILRNPITPSFDESSSCDFLNRICCIIVGIIFICVSLKLNKDKKHNKEEKSI